MGIVLFALRYKYTIAVLAILILLFGVLSARRMSTDILPRVDSPQISIVWTYTGLNRRRDGIEAYLLLRDRDHEQRR